MIFKNLEEVKCVGPSKARVRFYRCLRGTRLQTWVVIVSSVLLYLPAEECDHKRTDYGRDSGAELELKVIGSSE